MDGKLFLEKHSESVDFKERFGYHRKTTDQCVVLFRLKQAS